MSYESGQNVRTLLLLGFACLLACASSMLHSARVSQSSTAVGMCVCACLCVVVNVKGEKRNDVKKQ